MNHFSIVTVVKNDLLGLKRSRASLEMQSYKKWTHIIIDGGSTDGTLAYLKKLPLSNTTYVSEPDDGIYNAMNKAWKMANPNSFVFYLNARDELADKNSLTYANRALKGSPNSNWGCTTHEESFEDGSGWVCKLVGPPSVQNQLYAFGYRSHQAVVMKKSFIETLVGFDESFKIAADWDLIARAIQTEDPVVWNYPIAKFELGGMSSNRLLEAHFELRELRKRYLFLSLKQKFYDQLWSAIYLRQFGYRNYLSFPLGLLSQLSSSKHRPRNRQKTPRRFFLIISRFVKIEMTLPRLRIKRFIPRLKIARRINSHYPRLITYLHRELQISNYTSKSSF